MVKLVGTESKMVVRARGLVPVITVLQKAKADGSLELRRYLFSVFEMKSLYHADWSAVEQSWLTETSTSQVQPILLPQPPKQLGLQVCATTLGQFLQFQQRRGFTKLVRLVLNSQPRDPPTSASQSAGITDMSHHTWPSPILKNIFGLSIFYYNSSNFSLLSSEEHEQVCYIGKFISWGFLVQIISSHRY